MRKNLRKRLINWTRFKEWFKSLVLRILFRQKEALIANLIQELADTIKKLKDKLRELENAEKNFDEEDNKIIEEAFAEFNEMEKEVKPKNQKS